MPRGNGNVKKIPRRTRIDLVLNVKALSTNKLYAGIKKRSWHYKKYRKVVFDLLKDVNKEGLNLTGNLTLHIEVGFSSPLSDLSNCIKGIEDILCEWLSFDDRQIVSMKLDKYLVNKGEEYMKISICKTRKKVDKRVKYGKKIY